MNEYKTIKKISKIILPVKFKTYVQMCKRVSKFELLEQATFFIIHDGYWFKESFFYSVFNQIKVLRSRGKFTLTNEIL